MVVWITVILYSLGVTQFKSNFQFIQKVSILSDFSIFQ